MIIYKVRNYDTDKTSGCCISERRHCKLGWLKRTAISVRFTPIFLWQSRDKKIRIGYEPGIALSMRYVCFAENIQQIVDEIWKIYIM